MTAISSATDDQGSRSEVGSWQARISDESGELRGAGVLISGRHVLTCAHVLSPDAGKPTGTFTLEFPRSESGIKVTARVPDDGWFPGPTLSERDVAILEFTHPLADDVRPAELARGRRREGNLARVFGHTADLVDGVWSRVELSETVGPRNQRVQVSSRTNITAERIEQGFSGGGVLDETDGRVVGIIATATQKSERAVAFMIPMEVVGSYWPRLFEWIDGPAAHESAVHNVTLHDITTLLELRNSVSTGPGRVWVAERLPRSARERLGPGEPSVRDLVHSCRLASELRVLADLVFYRDDAVTGSGPIEDALAGYRTAQARPSVRHEKFGPRTRKDLHDLLMRQAHFVDKITRMHYLEAFRHRLWLSRELEIELPATDSASDDARALVDACSDIPGSVRMIVDDFPFAESLSSEFGELCMFIEGLSPRLLLTDDERDDLLRLIRHVPASSLLAAHQRASPVATGAAPPPDDVAALIRRVEGYSQRPDQLPRIFTLTAHLATEFEEIGESLRRWEDRTAARLRLRHSSVTEVRRAMALARAETADASADALRPVLSVQLAPDALRPEDRFLLTAVLEHGGAERIRQVLVRSDEPAGLDAVRTRLEAVLDAARPVLAPYLDELTLEIVLPRSLITEPVDRWRLPALAEDEPIGSRFGLILRSYERLHGRRFWSQWEEKSRLVRRQKIPTTDVAHFTGPDERPAARVLARTLRTGGKLALICGRSPAEQPSLRPADEYAAALEAGVPFVVWARKIDVSAELRTSIEEILASEPLRNLADRIADLRSEDWLDPAPGGGLGAHLSIVACDHDRETPFVSRGLHSPGRTSP